MITTLDKLIEYPVNNDPFWNDLLKKIFDSFSNKNNEKKG